MRQSDARRSPQSPTRSASTWTRDAGSASGGERRRTRRWSRALAMDPDMSCCLTSRPTTSTWHAIDWLENWLAALHRGVRRDQPRPHIPDAADARNLVARPQRHIRRKEIGFGGFEAWMETVYAEEARNADRLDAKLKIEAHWLERGVSAHGASATRGGWRNCGKCARRGRRCWLLRARRSWGWSRMTARPSR